jgi:hypothetical protein
MKLLKTIEKMIHESEEALSRACESYQDEKTITRLEKNYEEALKLMEMYERMKKVKREN